MSCIYDYSLQDAHSMYVMSFTIKHAYVSGKQKAGFTT